MYTSRNHNVYKFIAIFKNIFNTFPAQMLGKLQPFENSAVNRLFTANSKA